MLRILHCIVALLFICRSECQENNANDYPVIGELCPNFELTEVQHYPLKKVSLESFKGKLLILDFFSTGCTSCFKSFPKLNKLKQKYESRINFFVVGQLDKYIKASYEKYREKFNLSLPVAYDSIIFRKFKITGVPHILWIDEKGIVKAVTSDVREDWVEAFDKKQDFSFEDFSYNGKLIRNNALFNQSKPFIITTTDLVDSMIIQQSLLSKWAEGMPIMGDDIYNDNYKRETTLQISGWPLSNLYRIAYVGKIADWFTGDTCYGQWHYSPIYKIRDSSLFDDSIKFSYSQRLPAQRSHKYNKMEVMQRDLKSSFGYEVSIEVRKMPCLRLVATQSGKLNLIARGKIKSAESSMTFVDFKNVHIRRLIEEISYKSGLVSQDLPLMNETGIDDNIDIKFEAIMTDWKEIKKALQKIGLNLIIGEKEMKCLVIKDPH